MSFKIWYLNKKKIISMYFSGKKLNEFYYMEIIFLSSSIKLFLLKKLEYMR